jgi:hypothetical protein
MWHVCGRRKEMPTGFGWETELIRSLGRLTCRTLYNTKRVTKETGLKNVTLITVVQKSEKLQAIANTARNVLDPEISGKFLNR